MTYPGECVPMNKHVGFPTDCWRKVGREDTDMLDSIDVNYKVGKGSVTDIDDISQIVCHKRMSDEKLDVGVTAGCLMVGGVNSPILANGNESAP